uniref:Protein kinase domain-containing protein n=1 Tax=Brugia timori TaxID=42155 RepID=A0A0R3QCM1_9BILA
LLSREVHSINILDIFGQKSMNFTASRRCLHPVLFPNQKYTSKLLFLQDL